MTGEEVFTRDRSSGRIHRRFKMPDGSLASAEADNLDDAGASDEITAATVDAADPKDLCGRCFPSDGLAESDSPDVQGPPE
jgi:hypothetical protein